MLHHFPPLQMQPRRYFQKLPLQANFYPMPTTAYIQDSQYRLTLHTAQALGVSSVSSGEWGLQILMLQWSMPNQRNLTYIVHFFFIFSHHFAVSILGCFHFKT